MKRLSLNDRSGTTLSSSSVSNAGPWSRSRWCGCRSRSGASVTRRYVQRRRRPRSTSPSAPVHRSLRALIAGLLILLLRPGGRPHAHRGDHCCARRCWRIAGRFVSLDESRAASHLSRARGFWFDPRPCVKKNAQTRGEPPCQGTPPAASRSLEAGDARSRWDVLDEAFARPA